MGHNLLLTVQTPWHHLAPQPLLHREGPSAVPKGGGQGLIFLFLTFFWHSLKSGYWQRSHSAKKQFKNQPSQAFLALQQQNGNSWNGFLSMNSVAPEALFTEKGATNVNKLLMLSEQSPYLREAAHHPTRSPQGCPWLSKFSQSAKTNIQHSREWKDSENIYKTKGRCWHRSSGRHHFEIQVPKILGLLLRSVCTEGEKKHWWNGEENFTLWHRAICVGCCTGLQGLWPFGIWVIPSFFFKLNWSFQHLSFQLGKCKLIPWLVPSLEPGRIQLPEN